MTAKEVQIGARISEKAKSFILDIGDGNLTRGIMIALKRAGFKDEVAAAYQDIGIVDVAFKKLNKIVEKFRSTNEDHWEELLLARATIDLICNEMKEAGLAGMDLIKRRLEQELYSLWVNDISVEWDKLIYNLQEDYERIKPFPNL